MANRNYKRDWNTLEQGIVTLWGELTFTGVSGVFTEDNLGFTVSRENTGKYVVTLPDAYNALRQVTVSWENNSGVSDDFNWFLSSVDVTGSQKSFKINVCDEEGALGDPVTGTVMRLSVDLKNSSIKF